MAVQTQIQVRRGTASSWTSTNPTLAAGELGFETDTGKFKIGTGAATWTSLTYAGGGQNTLTTYQYTATSGQTTFSGVDSNGNTLSYTVGNIQVYLNGVLLVNTAEYTATSGTSIVLGTGAVTGDSLTVTSLGAFTVSSDIPKSTLTAKGSIVTATAGSTPANLSVGANGTVLTADSAETSGLKWATPSAGGMTLISTTSLTGSTTSLTSISGSYTDLILILTDIYCSSINDLVLSFNSDTTTANYNATYTRTYTGNTIQFVADYGTAAYVFAGVSGNSSTSAERHYSYHKFPRYASSGSKQIIGNAVAQNSSNKNIFNTQGIYFGGSAISQIDIKTTGGTFSAGTAYLYGVN